MRDVNKRLPPRFVVLALLIFSLSPHGIAAEPPRPDITGVAWDHLNAARYEAGLGVIEKALVELEPKAKEEASRMRGYDAKGREWDHGAVNIAGTLWLIRGQMLEKQGKSSEAMAAYREVVATYPYAQAWDPAGWFWQPAKDAQRRIYKSQLYAAISSGKLDGRFFPEKDNAVDSLVQRGASQEVAAELLAKQAFAELEAYAESARRHGIRLSNGEWMLRYFYAGVDSQSAELKSEEDWEKWRAQVGRWRAATNSSVTSRIAEASVAIRHAWHARGTGFAHKVKPEAWEVFGERIEQAEKLLAATPRKCPVWYHKRLMVCMAQGTEKAAYDGVFNEGWKAFPGYTPLIESKTYYLLPRWHGEPGDWQRFAADFALKQGAEYYPIAVHYASRYEKDEAFAQIDRALLRRGWEERIKKRPHSLALRHEYARTLVRLNDPHAKEWLAKLGDTYHAETWSSYSRIEEERARLLSMPE